MNPILPYGQLTLGDENLLQKWAKVCKDGNGPLQTVAFEIGTFFGRGAVLLSRYCDKVFTLDVFENVQWIENEVSREHYNDMLHEFPRTFSVVKKNLQRYPRIEVFVGLSSNIALPCDGLDLLFIDGDHSFMGVKADWDRWSPLVKNTGYIILHDTGSGSKWLEPQIFARTIRGWHQIDESDGATVWKRSV